MEAKYQYEFAEPGKTYEKKYDGDVRFKLPSGRVIKVDAGVTSANNEEKTMTFAAEFKTVIIINLWQIAIRGIFKEDDIATLCASIDTFTDTIKVAFPEEDREKPLFTILLKHPENYVVPITDELRILHGAIEAAMAELSSKDEPLPDSLIAQLEEYREKFKELINSDTNLYAQKVFDWVHNSVFMTDPLYLALLVSLYSEDELEKMTLRGVDSSNYNLIGKGRGRRTKQRGKLPEELKGYTKIATHAAKQLFGDVKLETPFSDEIIKAWDQRYSSSSLNRIDGYGVNLTDIQFRVMEGLVRKLTDTNYKGDLPAKTEKDILKEFNISHVSNLPKAYRGLKEIPIVRIGKRELVRLSGMDEDNQADMARCVDALKYLGITQYCFYYKRLAYDSNNKPERDADGNLKKEEVITVDTLFKTKEIIDEGTKEFKYFEVSPSAIFLDQLGSHFLLVPYNWQKEVRERLGAKKTSSYTFQFLLWLRLKFEELRRYNQNPAHKTKKPYVISMDWRKVAVALRMPDSLYKRKVKRARDLLDFAYQAAQELGYLESYTRDAVNDKLVLNPSHYPTPKEMDARRD